MQGSGRCFGQTAIAAAEISQRVVASSALIAIYGGILRLARPGRRGSKGENGNWFSEKIVLKQRDECMI
jgi:hypothetical protein